MGDIHDGRRRVVLTLAILFVIIFHPRISTFLLRDGLLGTGRQQNNRSNYLKRASVTSAHSENNNRYFAAVFFVNSFVLIEHMT